MQRSWGMSVCHAGGWNRVSEGQRNSKMGSHGSCRSQYYLSPHTAVKTALAGETQECLCCHVSLWLLV